jgi:hypothetical protein
MVEERVQKPGEPGIAYTVEKSCLFDLSPHVLTNAQKVSYLIGGLANWQHVAAMMNDTPADIDEFMTRLRNLETLFSTPRPNVSPSPQIIRFFSHLRCHRCQSIHQQSKCIHPRLQHPFNSTTH